MSEQIAVCQESLIVLEERVQVLRNGAEELLSILKSQYGETDLRIIRAGEICDALQRLRWEFDRQDRSALA